MRVIFMAAIDVETQLSVGRSGNDFGVKLSFGERVISTRRDAIFPETMVEAGGARGWAIP